MRSFRCLLGLHRWRETHRSYRSITLAHLHPMAGGRFQCGRCGKVFDDLPYGHMVDKAGRVINGPEELTP